MASSTAKLEATCGQDWKQQHRSQTSENLIKDQSDTFDSGSSILICTCARRTHMAAHIHMLTKPQWPRYICMYKICSKYLTEHCTQSNIEYTLTWHTTMYLRNLTLPKQCPNFKVSKEKASGASQATCNSY